MSRLTPTVAAALATAAAVFAMTADAWGHQFPARRSIVVQVDSCGVSLLVGYRPAVGQATAQIVATSKSAGKNRELDVLARQGAQLALSGVELLAGGKALVPDSIETKVSVEDGTGRPVFVVLVSFPFVDTGTLELVAKERNINKISWVDQSGGRVALDQAPAQITWHYDLASFLLTITAPCQTQPNSENLLVRSSLLRSVRPHLDSERDATKSTKKTTRATPPRQK